MGAGRLDLYGYALQTAAASSAGVAASVEARPREWLAGYAEAHAGYAWDPLGMRRGEYGATGGLRVRW